LETPSVAAEFFWKTDAEITILRVRKKITYAGSAQMSTPSERSVAHMQNATQKQSGKTEGKRGDAKGSDEDLRAHAPAH
jgi:hypothetical protein